MFFIFARNFLHRFLQDTIDLKGVVPPPVDLSDYMEITVSRHGKTRSRKIDVSGWSDRDIDALIEEIVNRCAHATKNISYDFATQKDSVALEIGWGLLSPYFDLYQGLTKTDWRDNIKRWYEDNKPRQLQIKGIRTCRMR
jgi:hypothetical protein